MSFSSIARPGTQFQDKVWCVPGTSFLQLSAGQSRVKTFDLLWIPACAGMTDEPGFVDQERSVARGLRGEEGYLITYTGAGHGK
jgi:hypothetical protein